MVVYLKVTRVVGTFKCLSGVPVELVFHEILYLFF